MNKKLFCLLLLALCLCLLLPCAALAGSSTYSIDEEYIPGVYLEGPPGNAWFIDVDNDIDRYLVDKKVVIPLLGHGYEWLLEHDYSLTLYDNGQGKDSLGRSISWTNNSLVLNGNVYSIRYKKDDGDTYMEIGTSLGNMLSSIPSAKQIIFVFYLESTDDTPTEPVSTANGFVSQDGEMYFMSNGAVDTGKNGIVLDDVGNVFYFCANGRVQKQHSGLAEYGGQWFYLENGQLDTQRTGLVNYDGGRFMVAAGRILSEYSGLLMDPDGSGWYFLAGGQVQTQYTGLAFYDGAWFYVENGRLAETFTGDVQYDGAWFHVVNGMVASQV